MKLSGPWPLGLASLRYAQFYLLGKPRYDHGMTYAEVKAAGAKIMGTPSYIPKDEWEEMSINRLCQIKADMVTKLPAVRTSEQREWAERSNRYLSKALEKAERGERVFGVAWDEEGTDFLFASVEHS